MIRRMKIADADDRFRRKVTAYRGRAWYPVANPPHRPGMQFYNFPQSNLPYFMSCAGLAAAVPVCPNL